MKLLILVSPVTQLHLSLKYGTPYMEPSTSIMSAGTSPYADWN